jgi:hypothetical protein
MPSQFEEYRNQVYQAYLEKKQNGNLPLNLEDPKPANLRDECLIVLPLRNLPNDEKILSDFFGIPKAGKDYAFSIYQYDLKLFKPLQNFLKGKTKQPETKNINLLAWLIDFEVRPFKFDFNPSESVIGNINEESIIDEEFIENKDLGSRNAELVAISKLDKEEKLDTDENITGALILKEGEGDLTKKRLKLNYVLVLIAVILTGFSVATLGGWINVFQNKECMYWKEDHFISISCEESTSNLNAIALDKNRLENFKKIIQTDSLKEDCIGKIWYSKIDKELEFYSASGKHPIHTEKGLKIVTAYVYDKYILKRDSSSITR